MRDAANNEDTPTPRGGGGGGRVGGGGGRVGGGGGRVGGGANILKHDIYSIQYSLTAELMTRLLYQP